MKRKLLTLLVALFTTIAASAIDYNSARREAYFLTDKMAYELNLSPSQYDRAYQINLDYLLSLNDYSDIDGVYWNYRNDDLRFVLDAAQYNLFVGISYFYRPVVWRSSSWYFTVGDYYRTGYNYFSRPTVYISYRGSGFAGRTGRSLSPYRHFVVRDDYRMRDRFDQRYVHNNRRRPDYRLDRNWNNRRFDNGNHYGNYKGNNGNHNGRYDNRNYRSGDNSNRYDRRSQTVAPTTGRSAGRSYGNDGNRTYGTPTTAPAQTATPTTGRSAGRSYGNGGNRTYGTPTTAPARSYDRGSQSVNRGSQPANRSYSPAPARSTATPASPAGGAGRSTGRSFGR